MASTERASQIVFFHLETTTTTVTKKTTRRQKQKVWVLEFSAIVVCPRRLAELESYCTFVRPGDPSAVPLRSGRSGVITRATVANSPLFDDVADKIFDIMDGRIWAGHDVQTFDCVRINEAFSQAGRPAPVPLRTIDSLSILTQKFGTRAGNLKMATLAEYFGLGQQKHRSLDDIRVNLEVLKHCATVMFLESSLMELTNNKLRGKPNIMARNRTAMKSSTKITRRNGEKLRCREESSRKHRAVPYTRQRAHFNGFNS